MKKALSLIISLLLCLGLCFPAAADSSEEVFDISGGVLTVRFPEGTEPLFTFLSGDYTMETLAEGETVDGFTSVSYILPEAACSAAQLFCAFVDMSAGAGTDIRSALLTNLDSGDLYCMGYTRTTPEYSVDISEGYEYSDGRTLYIRLPGSPATGYEWTMYPDDSGAIELVDSYEIDMRENENDPLVSAMGFFFLPVENPVSTEGGILFTLDQAPDGEPVGTTLEFHFRLGEDGQIVEADLVR